MATSASADVITFDGLGGPNGAVFTSYSEDGFTLSLTSGEAFQGTYFGNPEPSVVVGSVFDGGPTGVLSLTFGGADFSFDSFDFVNQNGNATYAVEGFLNGSSVYSISGEVVPADFATIMAGFALVDQVTFTLTATGTSLNLDNLVVGEAAAPAVPEPGTWAMLVSGFTLVGASMRRRQRARVSYAV